MNESVHIAVMTSEVIDALGTRPGGRTVDGTLGAGTYAASLLEATAPDGSVLSLDVDPGALKRARERFAPYGKRWVGVEANFRSLDRIAEERGFRPCEGVVLDLGVSSDELADASKGLSFMKEGPLDMRLGPRANEDGLTAGDIVNSWSRDDLITVIRDYGEERFAGRIADGILRARKAARLVGTLDLVSVIRSSVPRTYEHGRIHPATRTFQALRIAVNDELEALRDAIAAARRILAPGGRIAVVSFHSLEDRIVKHAFKEADDLVPITKRPAIPSEDEMTANPRSRSAKLRVAEKR
ncbi:16S rRNA (cytosine(1402)-N(4))-methyltransferase RsmH [Patescibacteria group bacterium]|nr:16S rRNA (cytosine(1402)-N(4))-methyltransferase RsmH [Patescibacteria group bacterium]MBU1448482.1 16S rRNA (cytosine(1402)-N(4))-methyltransferase RsmH [Patescibacteria group bacterium]MBU2613363.1 16S rRNA (cytosine(1402)-N(4))-methyltransferase RsmH [Patescibacteria group bacterium]